MFFNAITVISLLAAFTSALPIHSSAHGRRHSHRLAKKSAFGAGMQVTNKMAYSKNTIMDDGCGPGADTYTFYSGPASNFPTTDKWVSFDDMFNANIPLMQGSCVWNNWGPANTMTNVNRMKRYINNVARDSMMDHRVILAIIMQESGGCLHVPTTNNGVINPGIMQSHNGAAFDPSKPVTTIRQMIIDGVQGTAYGDGLVQLVNQYGDYYTAARAYNSGSVMSSDLSNGMGATPCYVSDMANRLTGWTFAASGCHA